MYSKFRLEMQKQFKYDYIQYQSYKEYSCFSASEGNIAHCCNGFFLDQEHLKNQFEWLTNADDLTPKVRDNLSIQLCMFKEVTNPFFNLIMFRSP